MSDRKLYLGPRLRVLRRELGFNQTQMAEELGISPSYLNHLERNQRPLTAQVLLRLTNAYDLDLREFVSGSGAASASDLQEILSDRLVRDIGIPRHEVLEVAENYPAVVEAIARFHQALGDLRRMPERIEQLGEGIDPAGTPLDWLRSTFEHRRNYFPRLDEAAEALSLELGAEPIDLMAAIAARLREGHGIATRIMPERTLVGASRHYDVHRKRLMVSEALPPSSRLFTLAFQLASEALADVLVEIQSSCAPPDAETAALLKVALINYAAAAILMPYGRFFEAAEESRYDLQLLQARFGTSPEQVAHRLTTLDRQGQRGVPFFFLKLDVTGNVSKRFPIENAPLPRFAGGCPRWDAQRAFGRIGEPVMSVIEHTNGARFHTIAIARAIDPHLAPNLLLLGCSDKHASKVSWADQNLGAPPIPVGVACNVCTRQECPARTMPPLMRSLDFRPYQRAFPYPFRVT